MQRQEPNPSPEYELGSQSTSVEPKPSESTDVVPEVVPLDVARYGIAKPRRVIVRAKVTHGKS
jgi:hypothetical protein